MRDLMVRWCALNFRPFVAAEDKGLRDLLVGADPRF